jgi:Family of unknown function (DUF6510)
LHRKPANRANRTQGAGKKEATCAACGGVAAIAESVVYPRLPGAVARCRSCGALLMVITHIHGVNCVDLQGIAALNAPPA